MPSKWIFKTETDTLQVHNLEDDIYSFHSSVISPLYIHIHIFYIYSTLCCRICSYCLRQITGRFGGQHVYRRLQRENSLQICERCPNAGHDIQYVYVITMDTFKDGRYLSLLLLLNNIIVIILLILLNVYHL